MSARGRSNVSSRRAQASLEYLVTYGWSFLVIILIIGSLSYFGVVDPQKFTADRCDFGSQLVCDDFRIDAETGQVDLRLRNAFGKDIVVEQIALDLGEVGPYDLSWSGVTSPGMATNSGMALTANAMTPPSEVRAQLMQGRKETLKFLVTIRRNVPGATEHNVTGILYARAE